MPSSEPAATAGVDDAAALDHANQLQHQNPADDVCRVAAPSQGFYDAEPVFLDSIVVTYLFPGGPVSTSCLTNCALRD